jgi:molybdopterin-guanine dinucleotide biosynthesis protein A
LKRSAIVLAGGISSRFGQDKGLLTLADKPLIRYVLEATRNLVDERIVVTSSKTQAAKYDTLLGHNVTVLVDAEEIQSPLIGAITGFQEAQGEHTLLLPCDAPFISKDILSLLFELCPGKTATIPRWPNSYMEPLQAVYSTKQTLEAAEKALTSGELNIKGMVDRLRGIRFISTLVLQQLDPELRTFFNVNTPVDLRRAESMLGK